MFSDSQFPFPPFDNIYSYGDCLEVKTEIIRTVLYWQRATSSMGTVNNKQFIVIQSDWALSLLMVFRLHDLSLCWCMFCFTSDSCVISLMFWRWRNERKSAPFQLFAPSPLLRVRSWLHPFKGHCEQKVMRDEWVICVAGYPLLNRRCTRCPGCFDSRKRIRN